MHRPIAQAAAVCASRSARGVRRALDRPGLLRWSAGAKRGQATASASASSTAWRPISVLDEWVSKEARPISLRQLMVFGKNLTESRLIDSANYLRTELPTRIAHRIRDMQQLPYAVVSNKHISEVYDLYYNAFDNFRKVKHIQSDEENDALCKTIRKNLQAHLTVIPKLAMGILESDGLMDPQALDKFMNTILRSRISRRVIAEQHLSLTETFHSSWFVPGMKLNASEYVGEVFIKCLAKDVVERCGKAVQELARTTYGPSVKIPEIKVSGHQHTSFPYILSHIEYIVGELLRNSVQAVVEQQLRHPHLVEEPLPPIEVTICSSAQHVILRISDRGGGIPRDELPYLWSFSKGPKSKARLEALQRVPLMAATLEELQTGESSSGYLHDEIGRADLRAPSFATAAVPVPVTSSSGSLTSLSSRPPDLRLGMGLPLSRVYAEYWAGSLNVHSLEGYGVDAFLQIPKLGNKNEQLATRATMDAV
ncbi:hypothetical protein TD95_002196 [Thielaviopsis punctulata]|uniref:Protein-serine/threonine kinase n=1 Tax=Thielaviopsis punctulata TaxID=72032 RepID=A0A0F4ZEM5_9PEZI|nr:hypothetical protein TD95_002196 [Thielaviopsis punctulata]